MLFLTPLQANQTRPRPRGRPTKFGHASCRRHLNIGPLAVRSRPCYGLAAMPVMATGHDANAVQSVSGRTNQHSLITGSQPAAEHHRPIHNGIARPPIVERITSSICSFTTDKQMAKLTETANYPSHEDVPERCIQYPPYITLEKMKFPTHFQLTFQ